MRRVLLFAGTTGYQIRSFGEAAARLGVEVALATDRCHVLDDPWRDGAVPVRFHDEDASLDAVTRAAAVSPFGGVLAVGDRPAVLAAGAARALGLPFHPPEGARAAGNKLLTRERLRAAGLPVPWFHSISADADPRTVRPHLRFPCLVKPLVLSGSRGVIRADEEAGFVEACGRLRRMLGGKDVRELRDPAAGTILVEGFVAGREYAIEGLFDRGVLQTLAIFDKPDPLDGPFFEETIYVTPPALSASGWRRIEQAVAAAAAAIGLRHGPVHAECRVTPGDVYVLEVAARPIGGLCARALRFDAGGRRDAMPLEELLLRHAIGEPVALYPREAAASGVMMVPVPRRGFYKGVDGLDEARDVPGIEEVRITAKPDQLLVPLPEGASYFGFIFAHAASPDKTVAALRAAHARLRFRVDTAVAVV